MGAISYREPAYEPATAGAGMTRYQPSSSTNGNGMKMGRGNEAIFPYQSEEAPPVMTSSKPGVAGSSRKLKGQNAAVTFNDQFDYKY
jgi:hypothetical protein